VIPLEDDFEDIVAKACRGLGRSPAPLPRSDAAIRDLAHTLGLRPDALLASARRSWRPQPSPRIDGLRQFTTRFGNMSVNSYLVVDPHTGAAAAFDTGADSSPMLEGSPRIQAVFITHSHADHIHDLARFVTWTEAEVRAPAAARLPSATPAHNGDVLPLGHLRITVRSTPGHSRDGTTYVVTGLPQPVAITGDALFAGSMGGAPSAWGTALDSLRHHILDLPDDTILCPGHGPMTTVAEEKAHNPFA
jgi:hydroxyacylglutathione hydrolase